MSNDIRNDTDLLIETFDNQLETIEEKVLTFTSKYDSYNNNYIKDATLLKKKMKEMVMKAGISEI